MHADRIGMGKDLTGIRIEAERRSLLGIIISIGDAQA